MASPFVPNTELTAIALGFKNSQFIADAVAPRVDVLESAFKWTEYGDEGFLIPNTLVGRRGQPNQVEFTATEKTDSVLDYGLEASVPQDDIEKARNHPTIDPLGRSANKLTELIALDREKRVADLAFNASNYNHTASVSAGDKWDNDSSANPLKVILDAIYTPRVMPNTLILGKHEAKALMTHPKVAQAFNGTSGSEGFVPLEWIRQQLGLESILVGQADYNAAQKGQATAITGLWSGGAALQYIKPAAQLQDDVTFALTADYLGRVAYTKEDDSIGLRGGQRVKVGESVKEVVISKEAGFFFDNVLS